MIGVNGAEAAEKGLAGRLKSLLRRTSGRLNAAVQKRTSFDETARVTLLPEGTRRPREWALLSYVIEPFLLEPDEPVPNSHTNQWESLQMARTLTELGFGVDVISYRNESFVPRRDYSLFLGARTNFERLAKRLPESCLKIAHLDTAHWMVNNGNAYARANAIRERRQAAVDLPRKVVESNWAIEKANCATILGNDFTEQSYRYAGKPIHRLPLPSCRTFDWPDGKDFDSARRRFVWFGSDGLVHKGLDLVLEAFAGMSDLELVVCGPVSQDRRFAEAFRQELFETSNIRTVDWVDIASDQYKAITESSLAVVYPSCSEGGGGSVITCMQAGLIPVVTRAASVDIDPRFGVLLEDASVEGIQMAVRRLSERPSQELRSAARAAWRTARNRYTRNRYVERFREVMEGLLVERPEQAPAAEVTGRFSQAVG